MRSLAPITLILLAYPAFAEDGLGTLNPEEMTIGRILDDAARGEIDMTSCASGYYITKAGRHAEARILFAACAEGGYTGAMTWMAQLDDNGYGAAEHPDSAAEWDRRAAEAGDPVGMFNLGLDLMRGRGVVQDMDQGRALVDRAAELGLPTARRLVASGYDLDEVTPDADNWKYAPLY
jgi:hypothetical protein